MIREKRRMEDDGRPSVAFSTRIDPELWKAVKLEAIRTDVSIQKLVTEALMAKIVWPRPRRVGRRSQASQVEE